ncbi:hypothetical protein AB3Z07_28025 (plasmid) [Metabacillus halosaccharovorans]|uniref:hypothetical protein n=1 Tax=Metabacillus halosaccharovorans TaxID=930124 RepID=UPI0015E0B41C
MVKCCDTCRFNIDSQTFDIKRCKRCSKTDRALYQPVTTIQTYLIKSLQVKKNK